MFSVRHFSNGDKEDILVRIDNVFGAISNRLLPAFASIVQEAEHIERRALEESQKNFNPEFMDEGILYEDAFHEGTNHYIIQAELRDEFIKSALTWMFHMFEKDCAYVFNAPSGDKKSKIKITENLSALGVDYGLGSSWQKCNTEMRLLANAIKHGNGRSLDEVKKLRPDYFVSSVGAISNNGIKLKEDDLKQYVTEMKNFWTNVFTRETN